MYLYDELNVFVICLLLNNSFYFELKNGAR